ncbi:MAG: cytochrome c biogenesis protein ResB, partial [Planctomycetota bacterium]|nr:cytochrome c biogenesis protein ResB [Planctomycetota bacterium]
MLRKPLEQFASLRLTVALLAAAMALIFVGTLAQTRLGVWQVVDTYFRSPVAWVDLGILLPGDSASGIRVPMPGGSLIAGLMIVNLLAAHFVRFRFSLRRFGVILLHAGLILLLAGEFVTGALAREGLMRIDEGGEASFVEDIRSVELAIIDTGPSGHDAVTSFPQSIIALAATTGRTVRHDSIPFDIEVLSWTSNAQVISRSGSDADDLDPALLRGAARTLAVRALPPVRGVDGAAVDEPAALVQVSQEGQSLGVWLLHPALEHAQAIDSLARFGISLRFVRTYKPYALHLIDFRHDKFTGTEIPKNFSSHVRIIDPERGADREALISMNQPLRYRGDALYQASYKPDGSGTVLQVVTNPGWLMPYIACGLVAGGMTLHFVLALTAFLRKHSGSPSSIAHHTGSGRDSRLPGRSARQTAGLIAVAALGVCIACVGVVQPRADSEYDIDAFARIPASAEGRIKPLDTVARNALMIAGGRQSVDAPGQRMEAAEYLLRLMARPETIKELSVVRVDHPEVLALLDRTADEGGRLSLAAIEPHWSGVIGQATRAANLDP